MNEKPKKGGSRPTLHMIDGKQMTVNEIATMLGVTRNVLINRHSTMGGISYQAIVNMYRDGQLLTKHDRWPRHLVHGRWMTVKQVAEELDCNLHLKRLMTTSKELQSAEEARNPKSTASGAK